MGADVYNGRAVACVGFPFPRGWVLDRIRAFLTRGWVCPIGGWVKQPPDYVVKNHMLQFGMWVGDL